MTDESTYDSLIQDIQNKNGKVTQEDFSMLSVIGSGSQGKVLLV